MAISAGSALLSAVGTGFTAGGLVTAGSMFIGGTMLSHFLVSTAIGAAINALTPKPTTPGAQGYTVTTRGSNLDHQIIYGQERVAGAVAADFLSGEGGSEGTRFLHRVQVMAGHEVESYEEVYVNSYKVAEWKANTAAGAGAVTGITDLTPWLNDPFAVLVPTKLVEVASDGTETVVEDYDFDEYNGLAMQFWTGADDQTASTKLIASIPDNKWTSDHRLRGLAYMYVRMGRSFDGDNFPTGVPEITAVIKGRKVYDPREVSHDPDDKSTWEWSDNPALCIRDYLTQDFGLGEKDIQVDDDLVSTAADVCERSALDGSPFYTCNGAFTTGIQPYDFLNSILSSMGGLLWYAQGQWRMKPAYWTPPTESFNEDDLRSSINVSTRHSRRDNFNTVQGSFRGPETNYSTTTFPAVTQAAFLTADGGIESSIDLEMPFTNTSAEARRIARIILERNRQQLTVSASFGLNAFRVQVGDVINLSLARFGWVNKTFEVTNWGFGTVNEYDIQVELTLREVTENVFDEVDDGVTFEGDNANVPSPIAGLAVTNLTATPSGFLNGDGTFVGKILVSWDAIVNSNVSEYIVEWGRAAFNFADYGGEVTSLGGSPTARETFIFNGYNNILGRNPDQEGFDFYNTGGGSSLTQTEFEQNLNNSPEARAISGSVRVDGATNEHTISSAVDDSMYSIRVKAVNDFGTSSKWATVTINTGKDDTIPSAPTGVSVTGGFRYITIDWTNPADLDLNYIEVWENTSNTTSGATLVGEIWGDQFVRTNLGVDVTRFYFLRAVDYSGNKSGYTSGVSATTTFLDDPDFENGIRTLFEEQGLYAIEDVNGLPASGDFVGQKVFNRQDGKLYEWDGSDWVLVVAAVEAPDISGELATNQIALDAITNDLIANDAVQAENIQNLAVNADKIASNAVTTTKIANAAVQEAKLANGAATEAKIATSAITETKISSGAVTTPKVAAGAITAGEIAAGSIQTSKIAAGAVTAGEISTGAITSNKIATNAITAGKVAAGAITASEIATGTITATNISAGAITASKIATNAITTNKIAAGAITANEITAGAITTNKIAAGAITADEISGNTITGDKISANTITGGLLSTSGIITNSAQINNGLITNAKIANAAITSAKIGNLEVNSAKIANLTVGTSKITGEAVTDTETEFDGFYSLGTGDGLGWFEVFFINPWINPENYPLLININFRADQSVTTNVGETRWRVQFDGDTIYQENQVIGWEDNDVFRSASILISNPGSGGKKTAFWWYKDTSIVTLRDIALSGTRIKK